MNLIKNIEIYTKPYCPYCLRSTDLLDLKGVVYRQYDISNDTQKKQEMISRSQRYTVPQVFIDDDHIGGSDELLAADRSGLLDELLSQPFSNNKLSNNSGQS